MTDVSSEDLESIDPAGEELIDEEVATLRAAMAAETPSVRREGARKAAILAGEDAATFAGLIDDVGPLLEADRASIAQHAASALLTVAPDYREQLTNYVPEMVTMAGRETNAHRSMAASLLGTVVVEHPEAVATEVHRLLPILHEETGPYEASDAVSQVDQEYTRQSLVEQEQREHRLKLEALGTLANVVVAVAEAEPGALSGHVDALVELYDHDDTTIAGTAIDATAEVARADPDEAAGAFDALVDCLDRDDERVQARAVQALGFLGDERAVEPLAALADRTDEDELAELARETVTFLEAE